MQPSNRMSRERRKKRDRRKSQDSSYSGIERRTRTDRRYNNDQRRHTRYRGRCTILVEMGSIFNEKNTGRLVDISRGGLAIRMPVSCGLPTDYQHLNLCVSEDKFRIDQIPYHTVSGLDTTCTDPGLPVIVQRYGLAFTSMNKATADQLDYFLANYTYGNA